MILAAFIAIALGIIVRELRVRRALEEARAAGNDLRQAIDTIPTIVWSTDPDGTVTFLNRAWRDFTGVSAEDAARGRWVETLHPDEAEWVQATRNAAVAAGRAYELDARLRRADGSYRWVLRRAVPLRNERGEIVRWYGTGTDIDDRKQAEAALRRARERALTARFTAALEERSRLAREIHDTLLQGFTGVALQLTALTRRVPDAATAAALGDIVGVAQSALDEARQAVWDLREPASADDSFAASLEQLAERALSGADIALDFAVRGVEQPIASPLRSVATRVLQESIANTIKHAGAKSVRVVLAFRADSVRLDVVDDGRGFAVDPTFRGYGVHWGLLGMTERAAEAGGSIKVRSAPGAGTRVSLRLPLDAPSAVMQPRMRLPEWGIAGTPS